MSWYTNPWFVGIIGSVPSGFLVNWLTGLILRKKENREYLQKVSAANREIIYAIRPGISEEKIPSGNVIEALRNATARRYGVEAQDLYTVLAIAEELTKEVMDSSFISSNQKQAYCLRLSDLIVRTESKPIEELDSSKSIVRAEYRERFVSSVARLFGVLTVTITLMTSLLQILRTKVSGSLLSALEQKRLDFLFPMLLTSVTLIVSLASLPIIREFSRQKRVASELEARLRPHLQIKRDSTGRFVVESGQRKDDR